MRRTRPAAKKIILLSPFGSIVFKGDFRLVGGIVTGGMVTGSMCSKATPRQAFDFEPLDELLFQVPAKHIGSELGDFLITCGIGSKSAGRATTSSMRRSATSCSRATRGAKVDKGLDLTA